MSTLTSDENAASELIGYVYTASISVLILSSMMLTSSTMLNGNVTNTAQEEAEQVANYLQLAIDDVLNTVRDYPEASPAVKLDLRTEASIHGIDYKINVTESGLKITTIQPRGGSYEVDFPLFPATSIGIISSVEVYEFDENDNLKLVETKCVFGRSLTSTSSYIVVYYDKTSKGINLAGSDSYQDCKST